MYPLKVILIGRDERAMPLLRCQLANNEAVVFGEFPDVRTLLARLESAEDEARLYLMLIGSTADVEQLKQLSSAIPGEPILAAINSQQWDDEPLGTGRTAFGHSRLQKQNTQGIPGGSAATASAWANVDPLFIASMRAGAMQVVCLPLDPEDFKSALGCLAVHFGRPTDSIVVAVAGVQGGSGTTTVAANLAFELSVLTNRPVILTEQAPRIGRLAMHLDIKPELTTEDLLEKERVDLYTIKSAMTQVAANFDVICGPYRALPQRDHEAGETGKIAARMLQLILALRQSAPIVVVDASATLDKLYFETLRNADWVVFVTEQTLPAIHGLQLVRQSLKHFEVLQKQVVVVNKYDPTVKKFSLPELQEMFGDPWIMKVSANPAIFSKSINEGQLLRLSAPGSPVLKEIDALAMRIANIAAPVSTAKPGILQRLFSARVRNMHAQEGVAALPQPAASAPSGSLGSDVGAANGNNGAAQVDMCHARLMAANLSKADLRGVSLQAAAMAFVDLSEADLTLADLQQASLPGADLTGANLTQADLTGADLSGSKLLRAVLCGAILQDANLSQADLTGARFDKQTIWPAGFEPQDAGARLEVHPDSALPVEPPGGVAPPGAAAPTGVVAPTGGQ